MKRNKLQDMKRVITWLELHELDHLDWSISSFSGKVSLEISPAYISRDEAEECRHLFGPLDSEVNYSKDRRSQKGKRRLDEDLTIEYVLRNVISCEPMEEGEINEMTDEDWEGVREDARAGRLIIPKCEEQPYKIRTA